MEAMSRATRNKYVQTPHGLFEMKSFFSNSISTTEDEAVSTKRVKQFIQTLVEQKIRKSHFRIKRFSKLLEEEHEIVISRIKTSLRSIENNSYSLLRSIRKTIG